MTKQRRYIAKILKKHGFKYLFATYPKLDGWMVEFENAKTGEFLGEILIPKMAKKLFSGEDFG